MEVLIWLCKLECFGEKQRSDRGQSLGHIILGSTVGKTVQRRWHLLVWNIFYLPLFRTLSIGPSRFVLHPFHWELFSKGLSYMHNIKNFLWLSIGFSKQWPSRWSEGERRAKSWYSFPWPPLPSPSSHLRLMKAIASLKAALSFLVPVTTLPLHPRSSRDSNSSTPCSLPIPKHTCIVCLQIHYL